MSSVADENRKIDRLQDMIDTNPVARAVQRYEHAVSAWNRSHGGSREAADAEEV